jgi:hypothetical protein
MHWDVPLWRDKVSNVIEKLLDSFDIQVKWTTIKQSRPHRWKKRTPELVIVWTWQRWDKNKTIEANIVNDQWKMISRIQIYRYYSSCGHRNVFLTCIVKLEIKKLIRIWGNLLFFFFFRIFFFFFFFKNLGNKNQIYIKILGKCASTQDLSFPSILSVRLLIAKINHS